VAVGGRRGRLAAAVLGALVVVPALSACNPTNDAVVSTTVVPPPPGCDTSRVVVVGASLDLSGPRAALGHQYLTGLELGIAKVNAANGVPPRNSCFELAYKDNRGNPTVDDQAMLDLVNVEKAGIVVGSFLGSATARYLGSLGVPAISLSSLAATFEPNAYPYTFPMTASMGSEAAVIVRTLKKESTASGGLVGGSVGLVVTNDPASRQGAAHLAAFSAAAGLHITARVSVPPSGTGAAAALQRLRRARPSVVVVLDDAGAVGSVLSARAAMGWAVPVIAGPGATVSDVAARLGRSVRGVSVVVPTGAVAGSGPGAAAVLGFRKRLLAHLGASSITGSIIAYARTYDAMTMMGNAANGSMGVVAPDVTSYLQNANYQGVLAAYTYTAGAHTGISTNDQTVVPLSTLSNGLLHAARSVKATP